MKTALITGAAKRIGKVIAEELLEAGFYVILHAHSSMPDLKSWVDKNPKKNQILHLVSADLSQKDGQDYLVLECKKHLSALNLLVHNASTFWPKKFDTIGRSDFQQMLAVNLEAPFFITQGLLDVLKKAELPSVINILDAMWKRPGLNYSHYAVSKAGLSILTRALANELAPTIRVNGVAPGAILFQPFHSEEIREQTIKSIPARRLGTPKDIAEAVIFLSEKAHYATGEIFVIDGGRSIGSKNT